MHTGSSEEQTTPLDIYLAYEYLPASQYARMLTTLDALYEAIIRSSLEENKALFLHQYFRRTTRSYMPNQPWLPLCIDSIETGKSISVRFAPKGQSGSLLWRERELDILLPRSTAPLCAIGVLLTGGIWGYEQYLDIQYKKAQIESVQTQTESTRIQWKLTAEQINLTKAQTADILEKQSRPKHQQRDPSARGSQYEIHAQIQNFYSIVNQSNITKVEVNGVDVREVSEKN